MATLKRKVNGTWETIANPSDFPVDIPVQITEIDADLTSLNAVENGTYTPQAPYDGFSSVLVNVPMDEGKNVQYSPVVGRVANNTNYATTGCSITVKKTGNYKCTWMHYAYASSSSYYLTRLYRGTTAIGTTHAAPAYGGTSGWEATENNVSLTAGQTVSVYARARSGTQYYTVAGMLVIEEL